MNKNQRGIALTAAGAIIGFTGIWGPAWLTGIVEPHFMRPAVMTGVVLVATGVCMATMGLTIINE